MPLTCSWLLRNYIVFHLERWVIEIHVYVCMGMSRPFLAVTTLLVDFGSIEVYGELVCDSSHLEK